MDDETSLAQRIKACAGGMLPLAVYVKLIEMARTCGGGTIVEIGTAQGAATIALAHGARAGGRPFRVFTSDPFDRGTRLLVGDVAENEALVRSGFERFGVTDNIHLVIGETAALIAEADPYEIRLLLIDADGQIDRDLSLLYDRLAHDGLIAIDDVDDAVYLYDVNGVWTIDQKHRLTHLLCAELVRRGALLPLETVGQTAFFRKGATRLSSEDWATIGLASYRALVFASLDQRQVGFAAAVKRMVSRRLPSVLRIYRRIRYQHI
jgi:predicted O-methyltransferase YrrM